jgi:hypothetical protein
MSHLLIENSPIPHGKVGLNTLIELVNNCVNCYCIHCESEPKYCEDEIHCTSDFVHNAICIKCIRQWNFIIKKVETPVYAEQLR